MRWFRRFRLSYAEVVEWLAERSTTADPSTEFDWVQKFAPLYEEAAKGHRHRVGQRWSVNETYVKVAGRWGYVYRAIQSQPFSFAPASYSTPADPNKTLWGYCRERLDVTKEDVKEIEGVYRIGDTRVSLNSLVYLFREGLSTESMVESYPSLTLEQVHGALAFYLANRADIDRYLAEGQRLPSRSTSYHATTMLS